MKKYENHLSRGKKKENEQEKIWHEKENEKGKRKEEEEENISLCLSHLEKEKQGMKKKRDVRKLSSLTPIFLLSSYSSSLASL